VEAQLQTFRAASAHQQELERRQELVHQKSRAASEQEPRRQVRERPSGSAHLRASARAQHLRGVEQPSERHLVMELEQHHLAVAQPSVRIQAEEQPSAHRLVMEQVQVHVRHPAEALEQVQVQILEAAQEPARRVEVQVQVQARRRQGEAREQESAHRQVMVQEQEQELCRREVEPVRVQR